jgi:hypothetical protein
MGPNRRPTPERRASGHRDSPGERAFRANGLELRPSQRDPPLIPAASCSGRIPGLPGHFTDSLEISRDSRGIPRNVVGCAGTSEANAVGPRIFLRKGGPRVRKSSRAFRDGTTIATRPRSENEHATVWSSPVSGCVAKPQAHDPVSESPVPAALVQVQISRSTSFRWFFLD